MLVGRELPKAAGMPVIYSADGNLLAYFQRNDAGEYTWWIAKANGADPTKLFATGFKQDDYIVSHVSKGCFSADGTRFAVLKGDGGRRPIDGGYCELDGTFHSVDVEGVFTGCAFAENQLLHLDSAGPGFGYRLILRTSEGPKAIRKEAGMGAFFLRTSPDGKRAAFLIASPEKRAIAFRSISLSDQKHIDTDYFPSHRLAEGLPVDGYTFFWDAEGKGLFYHMFTDETGSDNFALKRFDVASGEIKTVAENIATVAVLDKEHLLVIQQTKRQREVEPGIEGETDRKEIGTETVRRRAVLRLSDGKLFPFPEGLAVLGGAGRRVAIRTRAGVYCAEFTLTE